MDGNQSPSPQSAAPDVDDDQPNSTHFKSRKFLISLLIIILSTGCPILFHFIGISDQVTMMVLGLYIGVGGIYGAVNTIDSRNKPA